MQFALRQIEAGLEPTNEIRLPGVLSWLKYVRRRKTWNIVDQTIGLDAEFYEGEDQLLFPTPWLNHSEELARSLAKQKRTAKGIGVDPGQGVAFTTLTAVDELGILDQFSKKTPNTKEIPGLVIDFMRQHNVEPKNTVLDRGDGKQHADWLRSMGYKVRTVGFGDSISLEPRYGVNTIKSRVEIQEQRRQYKNRRTQMYYELHERCDPNGLYGGFAIPDKYVSLRQQLSVMPKLIDDEGRPYLPSKKELVEEMGRSPDEADSVVLALHAMTHKPQKTVVRAGI